MVGSVAHLVQGGGVIDFDAATEHGDEEVSVWGLGYEEGRAGVGMVDDGGGGAEECVVDHVGLVLKATDLEDARSGGFDHLVRDFEAMFPLFGRVLDGAKFVDAVEGGLVFGGDEVGAHPPDGDFGPLLFEVGDDVFSEFVAGHDFDVGEAGGIELFTDEVAEFVEVARVEAYAEELVLFRNADGMVDSGSGVVSVDEEEAVVGKGVGKGAEGVGFVVKGHDPAVRLCAHDGYAEEFTSKDVGSGVAAADVGGARGGDGAVDPLRAA